MMPRAIPTRRHALLTCTLVVPTAVLCAGLMTAAVLVPAPPVVVALIVATCIGCPMIAALELPASIAAWRAGRTSGSAPDARLLADMPPLPPAASRDAAAA